MLKNENRSFSPDSNKYIYMFIDDRDFTEERLKAWGKRRLVPRKKTDQDNRDVRLKNHENSTFSNESTTSKIEHRYYKSNRMKLNSMICPCKRDQRSVAVKESKYNQQPKYCEHIVIFMYTICNF